MKADSIRVGETYRINTDGASGTLTKAGEFFKVKAISGLQVHGFSIEDGCIWYIDPEFLDEMMENSELPPRMQIPELCQLIRDGFDVSGIIQLRKAGLI